MLRLFCIIDIDLNKFSPLRMYVCSAVSAFLGTYCLGGERNG